LIITSWLTNPLLQPAIAAALVAFAVALAIVRTQAWHGHLSIDSHVGVQKFHTHPTPRVGGIAIALGAIVGYLLAPATLQGLLGPLLLAGIPAFAFGLLEDVTKRVSVRTRLMATMFCGVLGWAITGFAITRANMPGLDWMLGFTVVSVAFTAFAVGGVANAINIIDGFNGLAAGSVIIMLGGFAAICFTVGDVDLVYVCIFFFFSMLGFLLINWPFGKLFLGDGGAYFVGFALAWIAVLILARHPEVSAWAPLMVCGYPILEVLFSILRRRRRGLSPGNPDRLHLHSIVKKRVVRQLFPKANNLLRNSLTGALMWAAALVPVSLAVGWSGESSLLVIGFVFSAFMYSAFYARLTQFRWCFRAATLTRFASA
jgi:UDP-N-acetylmuramyl pentapeptide phosphotransferase/UDP-N-acetylglucosamine-1-phosphate transferase